MKFDNDDELHYVIGDINDFVDKTRQIVYLGFGIEDETKIEDDDFLGLLSEVDQEDLDKCLTHEECLAIVNTHVKPRRTKLGTVKYIFNDNVFDEIIDAFNSRLVSNLLAQLVEKGEIESGWDDEENDFIFWIPDSEEEEKE